MRHLIKQEGYDDHTLADDIVHGFSLVCDSPTSSVLPPKLVPATISKEDLHRHSDKASKALRYMTRSSGDDELDKGLCTKTLAEVDKGWMRGPLPWDELPVGAAVSRRFPLSQSGKVRPIDDLSQSQVNSTVNTFEFGRIGQLALQDITKHAYANPFVASLSERLVNSLEL